MVVAVAAGSAQTGTEMHRVVPSDLSFFDETLSCFVLTIGHRSAGSGPTWHVSIVDGYH